MTHRRHALAQALCRALLVCSALLMAPWTAADALVTRITPDNVAELRRDGPDAIGGIGDYFLGNGTLCAVVAAVDHETDMSTTGGTLVDVGFCGRADDHYVSKQDLLDASRSAPVNVHRVEMLQGPASATLLAIGGSGGLLVETRYTVRTSRPRELEIARRIVRRHDDAPNPGLYAPVTFNYHSLLPFVFSSEDLQRSTGFEHTLFYTEGPTAIPDAARRANTIILVTPPHTEVPISYGWQLVRASRSSEGAVRELPRFALADTGALAFAVPVDEFWVGDGSEVGMMQLLQVPLLELAVGDTLQIDERLIIGQAGTVAAITDQLFDDAPVTSGVLVGALGDTRGGVHVDLPDGTPVTSTTADDNGRFSFSVPAGDYRLRILGPGSARIERPFSVGARDADLGNVALPDVATVRLPRGEAVRLVFRGSGGTEDPNLDDTFTGFVEHGGRGLVPSPAVFLAGIASDPEHVALAPGRYTVYATRGIEYGLHSTRIDVAAGDVIDLDIPLPERAVETPGYIAADLHVHAAPSMDNAFPVRERVRTFVAEHAEVMVAAEHETVFDFGPVVRDMGVDHRLVVINGTEMTSEVRTARMPWTAGHANFFPVRYQPDTYRRGAPHNENRRLRDILADVRMANPGVVTQLNHTRASDALSGPLPDEPTEHMSSGAYFDHLGVGTPFRPGEPIDSGVNARLVESDPTTGLRDIDFDAMELVNGPFAYSPTRTPALRRDWFSLMRQGFVLTGTANSDSHGKSQQVGLPRNMVRVADDSLSAFDISEFSRSLREGASYGTSGPQLEVRLGSSQIGDLHRGREATLAGRVFAPEWIDVSELRVQVDGHTVHVQELPDDGAFSVPLTFEADAFVTLEVFGEPGERYSAVFPGHRPYAFTNPWFVDADGDGAWSPPGL